MSDRDEERGGVPEYHVVYVEDPEPRWEVRYGKKRMGYQAWDECVAAGAAKRSKGVKRKLG